MFLRLSLIFFVAVAAKAASPNVAIIDPQGGQRGSEAEVVISGDRLQDAKGLLFYSPGIDVTGLQVVDAKKLKVKLKIADDCPLGEKQMRVWTATGISELHVFYVGPFPTVMRGPQDDKATRNDVPEHAQAIPLNVTVSGFVQNERADYYSVEAKKGQRLTAEVEGVRLGNAMFDPWLSISKKGGPELASCDDTPLLAQDPIVSIVAPEDGTYIVQVRDSTYAGGDRYRYRLHVGTFPQPTAIYPPGGPAGELAVRFIGDVNGPVDQKITLAAPENGVSTTDRVFAEIGGETAPAAIPFRISPFPNVLEAKPNNDLAHATKTDLAPPFAFNGIIAEKGATGFFRFKASRDQTFEFKVYARSLRSPLDSVLTIFDAQGKQLASNDDSGGPDSYLRFRIPADGDYCVAVTDQIKRGGPDYVYRVEVTPMQPELGLVMPQPVRDSQDRQTVAIPRGNRFGMVFRARRADVDGGGIVLNSSELPPGVTMQVAPMPPGSDTVPVVFEAAADAAVTGKVVRVTVTPADPTKKVCGHFEHAIDLVLGEPNNAVYCQTHVDKLATMVADEAPFKLHIIQPKAPIAQNGSMNLRVAVERKEGFHGDVEVSMLYNPPGINAQNSVRIPGDQNEGVIPLSANGDAPTQSWQVAVTGFTNSNGQVWACTPYAQLDVSPPFVTGSIDRGYAEQGQSATVVCKLTQSKPFEGKAKIQLLNLPNKVTAQGMEITSTDQQVEFPVSADIGSPVGQKRDLFCQVTVMKDGEPVVQNIAQGGIMRIGKAVDKK